MSYDGKIRNNVRKLRAEGRTYTEIMRELNLTISKSTISSWCSEIILPSWYQEKIDKINAKSFNKARKIAWASNKLKRERLLNELSKRNGHLIRKAADRDVLKMLLSILHLGEGSKWRYHRGLMLGSSDPDIIRLYIRLLYLCYGIPIEKLRCRISYRADQNIHQLQRYWSRVTSIPLRNFYKTKPDPRTVGRSTRRKEYKGVCVIMCSGTDIQLELEAIPKLILMGI